MTPVGVFFIYPNEDKLGFVNSANICGFSQIRFAHFLIYK